MKAQMNLLLTLFLCCIALIGVSASHEGSDIVNHLADDVELYSADDVNSFCEDLQTALRRLDIQLTSYELDSSTIATCLRRLPSWFPSVPIWLETDIAMTDRLGALVVKSLTEVERILTILEQHHYAIAIRRVDLLFYRLQIDGTRYCRLIARRRRGLYRDRPTLFIPD